MGLAENVTSVKRTAVAIGPFCKPYFADQQDPQEQSNLWTKRQEKIRPRVPYIKYSKTCLMKMLD
jgi:hypothetical protein